MTYVSSGFPWIKFSSEYPYIEPNKILYMLTSKKQNTGCNCQICCDKMFTIWRKNVSVLKYIVAGRKTLELCNTKCLAGKSALMML